MQALLAPQTAAQLPIFYLFWILLYLSTNIIWDVRSGRTPPFHISNLATKTQVLFNAASTASSLLILVGLFDKDTMKVAGDTIVPLMMAGFAGVFLGLSELCPYKSTRTIPGVTNI